MITGYRELNVDEIDAVEQLKSREADVMKLLLALSDSNENDPRWLAIAKTNIQQGFMAAIRSVTKPTQ